MSNTYAAADSDALLAVRGIPGRVPMTILDGTMSAFRLAESPWWSVADQRLYFVDSLGATTHRISLDGTHHESMQFRSEIGFAIPYADMNRLLIGMRDGLYQCTWGSERELKSVVEPPYDTRVHRINDGKTDSRGRLWFGTIHDEERAESGYLFSYSEGELRTVRDRVTTSNGIGWSPDAGYMYYTDSMTYNIYRYRYDLEAGCASDPIIFAHDFGVGRPDGLTVDSEGCVWSAKYEGGVIVRYAPDGRVIGWYEIPTGRPTSCAFVGADLTTLAVTTARAVNQIADPFGGSIFLLDVGVRGRPESAVSDS